MRKTKGKFSGIMLAAGIIMAAAALLLLIPTMVDYKKSGDTYEALKNAYVTVEQTEEAASKQDDWWYKDVAIQLLPMQEINEDIIGWIRFDNIEILSYPVLYSGDNETYLRSDIYGNQTTAGCIFMEEACNLDFNDCHTILYGHNMKDLSMFGSLKKYKTENFYKDNQYFTIYTDNMAYRYQIFSYRDVPETDSVYSVGFMPDETFETFVDEMMQASYENTGIEVTKEEKVLTLSTCSDAGNRFVVHAVRIAEHTYNGEKQ